MTKLGFTLIEILVVVLIIGILGAIMLPQYQRAVLKSRFAALMPIAKSMADSNEAYYLEHGEYADNAEDLPIQGRRNYSDGTELEFGTLTGYSYVLATRNNDFPNNYIVYQKHSEQFPGEIHCEADSNNTQAQEVCKSFGATDDIGETLTSGYLTYVLFGTGNGVAPGGNGSSGQGGVTKMTAQEAQAIADTKCEYPSSGCIGIPNDDGTVSVCENESGTVDGTGECVAMGEGTYEHIYDAEGNWSGSYGCDRMSDDGDCYKVYNKILTNDGGYKEVERRCLDEAAITKEGVCSNGYDRARDYTYDSHGERTSQSDCLESSVSTETGECEAYSSMYRYENNYDINGNYIDGVEYECTSIKPNSTVCLEWTESN